MEGATHGTITDSPDFNPNKDAELLRNAMKGIGTDENAITDIIGCRSNNQRQEIRTQFAAMYGKELMKELKSELSGNYEKAIIGLVMTPLEFDAYQCNEALTSVNTDEKCLIEILCTRSNAQILALRDAYERIYKKYLERVIQNETSGHFKKLLYALVQGHREGNEEPVDTEKVKKDAQDLYNAGEKRLGTDESRFNVVLASRSFSHLRLVFDEYQTLTQHTMEQAIESEMSGDLRDGMVAIVKCTRNIQSFFAEQLYKSMKGLGTNDSTLIRILVSRSEIDLVEIKEEFQRRYSKTLESFIQGDCSGDYKKVLLKLCVGNR